MTGWTDEQILNDIPYARFLQMLRVLHEELAEDARDALRVEAFGGWLHLLTQPTAKGKQHPSREKYFEMFGLGFGKPTALPTIEDARVQGNAVAERVQEAFKRSRKAVTDG